MRSSQTVTGQPSPGAIQPGFPFQYIASTTRAFTVVSQGLHWQEVKTGSKVRI